MPGDLAHPVTLNRMLIEISILIERSKVNDKVKIHTRLFSYHSYTFILDILSMLYIIYLPIYGLVLLFSPFRSKKSLIRFYSKHFSKEALKIKYSTDF